MPKTATGKEFDELQIKYVPVGEIIPYERNTKVHPPEQIAKLKASIHEYNFDQPIVVDGHNVVIKGHGRLLAAQALGLDKVPVIVRDDLTENQVKAARIADNKVVSAMFDDDMMMLEIAELKAFEDFDPSQIGFDTSELKTFEDEFNAEAAAEMAEDKKGQADEVPEGPDKYTVSPGDVFQLGNHKVVCGSSTDPLTLKALLGAETVDMLLTDPPYGVSYGDKNARLNALDGGSRMERKIGNDDDSEITDYRQFFASFLSIIPMSEKNTAYITLNGKEYSNLHLAFEDAGFFDSQELIWLKNVHTLSRKDYHPKHEMIMYGWKGSHEFHGDRSRTSVIQCDRPRKADLHPTMKPVALFVELIKDGSAAGDIVYDAFAGSGTTVIACENTGRRARVVEQDPHYVSVIVQRWEEYTGKTAVLLPKEE